MSEQGEIINFIGEQFRRLNHRFDRLELDIGDIKARMVVLEESSARVAAVEVGTAGVIKRMDRLEGRLERIERRLDLVEAH